MGSKWMAIGARRRTLEEESSELKSLSNRPRDTAPQFTWLKTNNAYQALYMRQCGAAARAVNINIRINQKALCMWIVVDRQTNTLFVFEVWQSWGQVLCGVRPGGVCVCRAMCQTSCYGQRRLEKESIARPISMIGSLFKTVCGSSILIISCTTSTTYCSIIINRHRTGTALCTDILCTLFASIYYDTNTA